MWTASNVYLRDDGVRIRPMQEEDIEQLLAKMAELGDDDRRALHMDDPKRAEAIDFYIRHIERVTVVEHQGDLLGCFIVIPKETGMFLDMIVIFPEYRGNDYSYDCITYFDRLYNHCHAITDAGESIINHVLQTSGFNAMPIEGDKNKLVWEMPDWGNPEKA